MVPHYDGDRAVLISRPVGLPRIQDRRPRSLGNHRWLKAFLDAVLPSPPGAVDQVTGNVFLQMRDVAAVRFEIRCRRGREIEMARDCEKKRAGPDADAIGWRATPRRDTPP